MRIGVEPLVRVRDAHEREQLDSACVGGSVIQTQVSLHRLRQLAPYRQHRVQRGHRLLEDHPDAVASDIAHRLLILREQILVHKADAPAHDTARRAGNEAHDGERGDALAAAALTHQRERLSFLDVERDAVDGFHHAPWSEEVRTKIVYFQQRAHRETQPITHRLGGNGADAPDPNV